METFNLLKSKYLDTKLSFLNALEKRRQYADVEDDDNASEKDRKLFMRFSSENWEAYIAIIHAADLMLNYVADSAMCQFENSAYWCFIEGEDQIEDQIMPQFPFLFRFLALPNLEAMKEDRPELEDLCDRIQFRNISIDELIRELDKLGIPHSDEGSLDPFSDNEFMRRPFSAWVYKLVDHAESLISDFAG